jgi:hypothetical protein
VLLKDVESTVEGDGGAGSWGGLVEGDVGNGARASEDIDAHFFCIFLASELVF